MSKNEKKKFNLGDIIRKLNEGKDPTPAEEGRPSVLGPAPVATSDGSGLPPTDKQTMSSFSDAARNASAAPEPPGPLYEPRQNRIPVPTAQLRPTPKGATGQSTQETTGEEPELDLFKYLNVIIRRRNIIILTMIAVGLYSAYVYITAPKFFLAKSQMLFSPGSQEIISDNSRLVFRGTFQSKINTHLELLKSRVVLARVAQNLGGEIPAGAIAGGLKISQVQNEGQKTDIIELLFKHERADIARDVVNEICRSYIEYIKDVGAQDIDRLIFKLRGQIDKVETELDERQAKMREFKEQNRLVQMSEETNLLVSKSSQMQTLLQATELELVENNERLTTINFQVNKSSISLIDSLTYENPYRERIAAMEIELSGLLAEYSPEHFKVQNLKRQIARMKESIRTDVAKNAQNFLDNGPVRSSLIEQIVNLSIDKEVLHTKRAAVQKIVNELNEQILALPTKELVFASLQRDVDASLQVLSMLKGKLEDAKIKRDSQESDVKIFELSPDKLSPISTKKVSSIFLGMLIGLLIGIVFAFILEYFDQSIKEPADVERELELPLLGVVPMIEAEKGLIENSLTKGKNILEPFRALRANIKHLIAQHNLKTFIVFSGVKGEGKTTLAANLAITFAMDGKKIILVDADLRRSQMHGLFHLPKEKGLSEYLLATADITEVIKPTRHKLLSVVTAGERPHNPAELVGTYRFDLFIKELRERADIIIFDSPALLPVSDSITMAPKMDACLMIVRALWTPLKAAHQAQLQLKRIGCNILGVILNGMAHGRGYYPYYYGYNRYYAYKYTYDYEDESSREKFSLREFGLSVESRVRIFFKNLSYSMPHYLTNAKDVLASLARRRLFWLLLLLLSMVIGFYLYMAPHSTKKKRPWIEYIGVAKPASGHSGQTTFEPRSTLLPEDVVSGNEDQVSTPTLEAIRDFYHTPANDMELSSPSVMVHDSLVAWFMALKTQDLQHHLSLYNDQQFSYPDGTYKDWVEKKRLTFFELPELFSSIHIDTLGEKVLGPGLVKSWIIISTGPGKTVCSMIWQRGANGWRIIREKSLKLQ